MRSIQLKRLLGSEERNKEKKEMELTLTLSFLYFSVFVRIFLTFCRVEEEK